jgi:hypothetical protein
MALFQEREKKAASTTAADRFVFSKLACFFDIFAALAILTKGNGYALVVLRPLTILFARRFDMLANVRLWLAGLPIAVSAVWSVFTKALVAPTFPLLGKWHPSRNSSMLVARSAH